MMPKSKPLEGYKESILGGDLNWTESVDYLIDCSAIACKTSSADHILSRSRSSFEEMGIGRGGKIIQKIYPDSYGIEVWQQEPSS